ncbi:MAG: endolytic transglycosylase MltG, partial [Deltaproteobacteria bacterium]|nr:endolytic transglycosylase MltG [Deltaproteobacteria bacterium]
YKLPAVTTEEQIVTTMLATFERRFTPEMEARGRDIGMTRHQVVTLASIIEKEGGPHDEWAMVSAVFHNRLKRGMRLQSDPTVIYGLEDFNGNLTRRDLRTPGPYNTYRISGLPPGPIANPGLAAINAALFPAAVDYLYFVSKNDGSHHFSVTLREHNKAVDKYQRNGRTRSRKVAAP